jgi:hypothetical protein
LSETRREATKGGDKVGPTKGGRKDAGNGEMFEGEMKTEREKGARKGKERERERKKGEREIKKDVRPRAGWPKGFGLLPESVNRQ